MFIWYGILLKKHRRRFFIPIIFIASVMQTVSCTMKFTGVEGEKGFYSYSQKEVVRLLEIIGLPTDSDMPLQVEVSVKRNSDGSAIRIFKRNMRSVVNLSCDGTAETIRIPSGDVWLNDDNHVVARSENGWVYYKNGMVADRNNVILESDPSGKYFAKSLEPSGVGIFSVERPDICLVNLPTFTIGPLFVKNNKIFLFASNRRDKRLRAFIFKTEDSQLIKTDEIILPNFSHYHAFVEDLSPWKDEVIIVKGVDVPLWPFSTSKRYSLDLKRLFGILWGSHLTDKINPISIYYNNHPLYIYRFISKYGNGSSDDTFSDL